MFVIINKLSSLISKIFSIWLIPRFDSSLRCKFWSQTSQRKVIWEFSDDSIKIDVQKSGLIFSVSSLGWGATLDFYDDSDDSLLHKRREFLGYVKFTVTVEGRSCNIKFLAYSYVATLQVDLFPYVSGIHIITTCVSHISYLLYTRRSFHVCPAVLSLCVNSRRTFWRN
jgi:hypothetical protein